MYAFIFFLLAFAHNTLQLDCSDFSPITLHSWVFDETSIICEDTAKEFLMCKMEYFKPKVITCYNSMFGKTNMTNDEFWNLDGILLHWICESGVNTEVLLVCPKEQNLCNTEITKCRIIYNPLLQTLWYVNIALLFILFIICTFFSIIVCYMTHCSLNIGANFGRKKSE